jgi:hypothetical protein
LRAVESEFELLVGCHNGHRFGCNYDTTIAGGVGQRLSKAKFLREYVDNANWRCLQKGFF